MARLFSSGVIRDFARHGHSRLAAALVDEAGLTPSLEDHWTLGELFDRAFSALRVEGARHEYVYKNAIASKVLLGRHNLNTACMLSEFRVGNCKVDAVILNGTSVAYEIKSERDNFDRLEGQLRDYRRVFDRVYVVTCESHVASLEAVISPDVGILVLTPRFTIREHRIAAPNVGSIQPQWVFESLQRAEYLAVLRANGVAIPDLPNTRIHTVARELFASLAPEQAHDGMVRVLKSTRSPSALQRLVEVAPSSLKAAALSVPLTAHERSRLAFALGQRARSLLR